MLFFLFSFFSVLRFLFRFLILSLVRGGFFNYGRLLSKR